MQPPFGGIGDVGAYGLGPAADALGSAGSSTGWPQGDAVGGVVSPTQSQWRDPAEERIALNAKDLLLHPQKAWPHGGTKER